MNDIAISILSSNPTVGHHCLLNRRALTAFVKIIVSGCLLNRRALTAFVKIIVSKNHCNHDLVSIFCRQMPMFCLKVIAFRQHKGAFLYIDKMWRLRQQQYYLGFRPENKVGSEEPGPTSQWWGTTGAQEQS